MPLQAFFCSLCREYTKDTTNAELHLKSSEHNNKFKVISMFVAACVQYSCTVQPVIVCGKKYPFKIFCSFLAIAWNLKA